MSDRHPKWVRVEPGTVIPAGQPYRTESRSGLFIDGATCCEFANGQPKAFKVDKVYDGAEYTMRVDSSWKPPLDLPTEPTWGIAVVEDEEDSPIEWIVDRWTHEKRKYDQVRRLSGYHTSGIYEDNEVLDFIPLTDEQVARITVAPR